MTRVFLFALAWVVAAVGVGSAQPTGEDLAAWARAHWDAVGKGRAEVVAAGFAPDGGVAFLGTPVDGFYYGPRIQDAWSKFFAVFPAREHALTGVVRAVAEASLVYGELELSVPGDYYVPRRRVVVASFLRFAPDGKIRAADYVAGEGFGLVAPTVDGRIVEGEYRRSAQDKGSGVTLSWRNGLVVLFAAVRSPGTGWLAAGFDPLSRMQGANFIIAALTADGLVIEDHFGIGPTSHRRDARSDVLRAAGTTAAGHTIVEFVIPLDSGDAEDKPLIPGRTYTVLLSYHRTSTSFAVIHSARGSVQMELDG